MVEMTGPRVNRPSIQSVAIMVHRGSPRPDHDYPERTGFSIMCQEQLEPPRHDRTLSPSQRGKRWRSGNTGGIALDPRFPGSPDLGRSFLEMERHRIACPKRVAGLHVSNEALVLGQ